jgi:DNA polymerase elongation subunit (family B)
MDALYKYNFKKILPVKTNNPKAERTSYAGAYVYAKPGLYENCTMFDVVSLYPSIIIAFNIGLDTKIKYGESLYKKDKAFKAPNGSYWLKEPSSILASIEKLLWDERTKYKKLAKETTDPKLQTKYNIQQGAYKICLNSLYGLFGMPYFRFYDPVIAETITKTGVFIINMVKTFLESSQIEVVQVDTDGLTVVIPKDKTYLDILSDINNMLATYVKENGLNWNIQMDCKGVCDKVLVLKKKKYIIKFKDSQEIKYVGVDVVRSDISEFAKRYVNKSVEKVLNDGITTSYNDIAREIKAEVKREIYSAPITDIAVPKAIKKDIGDYKVKNPWTEGAELANVLFGEDIGGGEKPKMLYIKPIFINNKWYSSIAFIDPTKIDWSKITIDYGRMLDQTIYPKLYAIFEWVMTWKEFQHLDTITLEKFF